ncbi:hypothetical protein EI94DRAFT_1579016, partial [Lactarius quietus]
YSASATECTNSLCTNVSVICPLCPSTSAVVWKYDMKTHLACIHPSTNRSDSQKGYVTLGEADLRLVLGSQAQCCFESSSNF